MDNIFTAMGLGDFVAVAALDVDCCDDYDPRQYNDDSTHMVCWHRNYALGDERPSESPDEWLEALACSLDDALDDRLERMEDALYNKAPYRGKPLNERSVSDEVWKVLDRECEFLSLSLLDHSGLRLYEGSGPHWSDCGGWDSGQVGWIYMTRADILREFGGSRLTRDKREKAKRRMRAELAAYSAYVAGEIYYMQVFERTPGMSREEFAKDLPELNFNPVESCGGFLGADAVEADMRDSLKRLHSQRLAADDEKIEADTLPSLVPWFKETLPSPLFGDEIVECDLDDLVEEIERRAESKLEAKVA